MRTPHPRRATALVLGTVLTLAAASAPVAAIAGGGLSAPGGATRLAGDQSSSVKAAIKGGAAKNVILLIGDGMGDSEITIARNYAYGAAGRLPGLDALPLTGSYTTYSLHKDGPEAGRPDYVTDSAASGSAWATGTKTYDGAISVDLDGTPHDTLLELAKANGLKTGDVSTAEIQDATPAVQVAHVGARGCYAPTSASCGADLLQNGGRGSISEQLLDARPDLVLGGGATSFSTSAQAGPWAGKTLFDQARERGYRVLDTPAGLSGVTTANQTRPVLGLFTPGNFPTRFLPTLATAGGADQPAVKCSANPARTADLSLAALTSRSIDLLDTPGSKGFFLQVEGASIDKRDHSADACGQIGETLDLDEAVQAALEFAKRDKNTLVIVTADHAHTSQIVDEATPGLSIAVRTADQATMKIAYGTAAAGQSQQHTGTQVRIAGYGPHAGNVVGLTDQTDTFFTIARALRLNRDPAALSAHARVQAPRRATAGEQVSVTVKGLNGDRQVKLTQGQSAQGQTTLIAKADLIAGDGVFAYTVPAGTPAGVYRFSVTGLQTGAVASADITVR